MSPELKAKLRKFWDRVFFCICLVLVVWAFAFEREPDADPDKMRMRYVGGGAFHESQLVKVTEILDGDELVVQNEYKQRTILRLLGVRAFNPKSPDNRIAYFGQLAYIRWGEYLLGQEARLETQHLKTDKKDRLLGHLYLEGDDGAYSRDIALDLLRDGLAIVYPLHDIGDRAADYQNAQTEARDAKREIWGDERAIEHVAVLTASWEAKP
jgi:endonuclease YncB( thermonuclease family)